MSQLSENSFPYEARPVRVDAQRNIDALLEAAAAVFATSGVDAPVREIAGKAGVGMGTLYRHFPQRSHLIIALFRREVDACADAAALLAARHEPGEALGLWMQRFVDFVTAKRGLAAALHSGDPAYDALPSYFRERLRPAVQGLMNAAVEADIIRDDIAADDLLSAVPGLCMPGPDGAATHSRRMVALLVDGLHYRADAASNCRLQPV